MSKVQLEWMGELPWKMQSAVLSGLRGPDTGHAPQLKLVTNWLRSVTQNNAHPGHSYMDPSRLPTVKELEKELEFTTVHFAFHLLHALEIIAYKHPDPPVSGQALTYYEGILDLLKVRPEERATLESRLRDMVEHD